MFFQSEKKLITKAQQGNKQAWLKLVKQYEAPIYHYCLRMLNDPHDATDMLQETFISIYKSLDSFRFDSSFKTWAISIAHFRCIELFRKRKPVQSMDDNEQSAAIEPVYEPENTLQLLQTNAQVRAALASLPWQQRNIVELKFFQHFTFEQIGQQLGIPTNTVKSRMYNALDKLKPHLEVSNV